MNRLLHNTAFQYMGYFWALALGLVLPPYIISEIGLREFGVWALIMAIVRYFELMDFGVESTLVRYVPKLEREEEVEELSSLASTAFTFQLLLGGVVMTATFIILTCFTTTDYKQAIALAVTAGVVRNISLSFRGVIMGFQKMAIPNTIEIAGTVPYILGVILSLHYGYGVTGIFAAYLLMTLLNGIALYINAVRLVPRLGPGIRIDSLKKLLRFGIKLQISRLAQLGSFQLDKILIGLFINVTSVGFYDIGAKITTICRNLPLIMVSAVPPAVSEMVSKGETEKIPGFYLRGWRYLISGGAPLALFSIAFAPQLILAWIGEPLPDAAWTLRLLTVGYFLNMVSGMASATALGMGRPDIEMKAGIIVLVLNPLLSISLIFTLGFKGVLIGTAFSLSMGTFYLLKLFRRLVPFGVRDLLSLFPPPLLTGGGGVLLIWFLLKPFFPLAGGEVTQARLFILTGGPSFLLAYYVVLRMMGHIESVSVLIGILRGKKGEAS